MHPSNSTHTQFSKRSNIDRAGDFKHSSNNCAEDNIGLSLLGRKHIYKSASVLLMPIKCALVLSGENGKIKIQI